MQVRFSVSSQKCESEGCGLYLVAYCYSVYCRLAVPQVLTGSEKSAVLVFVTTETERQASWSRLEGLILHWCVLPPRCTCAEAWPVL